MNAFRADSGAVKVLAMVLAFILAAHLPALAVQPNMPFNGAIAFHKISLTIPSGYIRDSTQSTEDFWIFEKGFYSRYIMLSRKDLQGDADEALDAYAEYLKEQGVNTQRETFCQLEALRSESLQGDSWREILFAHDGSLYAVAIRGGTGEEMQALIDTIAIHDVTPEITAQPDKHTMFGRIFDYAFGK